MSQYDIPGTGMLWYDNDPKRPPAEKIERAMNYYFVKYGRVVTQCHVHPGLIADGPVRVKGVKVTPDRYIMPDHFWLGLSITPK